MFLTVILDVIKQDTAGVGSVERYDIVGSGSRSDYNVRRSFVRHVVVAARNSQPYLVPAYADVSRHVFRVSADRDLSVFDFNVGIVLYVTAAYVSRERYLFAVVLLRDTRYGFSLDSRTEDDARYLCGIYL